MDFKHHSSGPPWYDSPKNLIRYKSKTLNLSRKLAMSISFKWAASKERKQTIKNINVE
jgi:hypothetical protein